MILLKVRNLNDVIHDILQVNRNGEGEYIPAIVL